MANNTISTDCKECKRHFLAIAAVVVCLACCLIVLKVDDEIIADDKDSEVVASKTVGLVLARGGSKGLPRKNLALVNNRTLLARALSAMQLSHCFDELWVSTEDKEISEEALRVSANVHERPIALAQDNTSSVEAVREFLDRHPDVKMVGLVQCTSPFIRAEWLQQACHLINTQHFDSVFSVTRHRALRWQPAENGTLKEENFDVTGRPRRQDWSGDLVENGMFYFASADIVKQNMLQGGRIGYVEVPRNHSLEVDTPLDLVQAQALASILDQSPSPTAHSPD